MTDSPQLHWTENEELLEQYVLGRVDPGRRNELESHLRFCGECRRRVEAEETLAGGVRRLGRDQLRQRLASRTRPLYPRQLQWQHIAAAAAVIIIAASIGIYQWWLTTQKSEQTPAPSAPVTENAQPESAASATQATDAVSYAAKEPAGGTEATPKGTTNNRTGADQSSPVRRDIPRNPKPATTAAENQEEPNATAGQEEVAAAKGARAARSGELSRTGSAEEASTTRSLWVDGALLPGESTGDVAANQVSPAKTAEKGPVGKVMGEKEESVRQMHADSRLAQKGLLPSLHQRLFSTLPAAQQQLSVHSRGRRVPTKIDKLGGSLSLTIYLDTLYDKATWTGTRVRMVGTDSLIVDLPGQRIGYKLPPEWNTASPGVPPAGKRKP